MTDLTKPFPEGESITANLEIDIVDGRVITIEVNGEDAEWEINDGLEIVIHPTLSPIFMPEKSFNGTVMIEWDSEHWNATEGVV